MKAWNLESILYILKHLGTLDNGFLFKNDKKNKKLFKKNRFLLE